MDKFIDNNIKEFVMLSSTNYIYNLGEDLVNKYCLEHEIAQINRVFELILSSSLSQGSNNLSRLYHIAEMEFKYYNDTCVYLQNSISDLNMKIEDDRSNSQYIMSEINNLLSIIDPTFNKFAKRWQNIQWPSINIFSIPYNRPLDDNVYASELSYLLPETVKEATADVNSMVSKKEELEDIIKLLVEIKTDLENIIINLIPESNIIN